MFGYYSTSMAALSVAAGVTALVALALAALSWDRRERPAALPFTAMMGINAVWIGAFAVELAAADAAAALPWFRVRAAAITFVPATWFLFAVAYGQYGDGLTRRVTIAVCAVPTVNAVLALTNGSHGLFWSATEMTTRGSFRLLTVEYAVGWWISVAYSYLLIGAGVVLIAGIAAAATGIYRRQAWLVLVAAVPPALANVVYLTDASPVPELDLTPFAFILEGVIVFWALFGYRLLDRVPVARSAVVETMGDPMVAVDGEGFVVDSNAAAGPLSSFDAPHGNRFDAAFPSVASAVDTDAATAAEEVVAQIDGRPRYFEPRVTSLSDRDGVVVVLRDVTRRRTRERSLEAIQDASRDLMRATTTEAVAERTVEAASEVLDLKYVGIHLLDDDERLTPVAHTEAVRDLYDPVPSYAVGEGLQGTAFRRGERLVFDDVHEADDCALKDESVPVRGVALFPLGEYGVLAAGSPDRFDADDMAVSLASVLAANAAAALARAEREADLKHQNERLDEFAGIVSHDLRNPLTVASGYLDVARETGEESAFTEAEDALRRMDGLVDDLLELARSGREMGDPDPVRLSEVATAAWSGTGSPDATLDLAVDDAVVVADRSRLRQLLENLFRNAVEHASTASESPPSGSAADGTAGTDAPLYRSAAGESPADVGGREPHVTVTVGTLERAGPGESGPVGFYVADDGPGIPAGERDRVFDHGYTTDEDGTGIGLAIVREAAEAHGWSPAVTDSPAGGARFEFTGVEFR